MKRIPSFFEYSIKTWLSGFCIAALLMISLPLPGQIVGLKTILKETQYVLLNHPVGYAK